MGVDLATIGVGVDTTDLKSGEAALDQFATEGERTEARVKKSTGKMGTSIKGAGKETKALSATQRSAASGATALAAAERQAAAAASELARQNRAATGQTANLTAQFNDIGVMLAAGQNPLQLALQQGTQINQVFQQMGGGMGAVRSLGPALMSMVSPMSLLTLGTIAGGAALFQFGMNAIGAGEEAKTFEEQIEDVQAALNRYAEASDQANQTLADMTEEYGSANHVIRGTLELLEQLAQNESQRAIDGVATSLGELMSIGGSGDRRAGIADFFDVNIFLAFTEAGREARGVARELTAEFYNSQQALLASNGDAEAQVAALSRMLEATQALAEETDGVSAEEEAVVQQIAEALLQAQKQLRVTADISEETRALADAERLLGEQMIENIVRQEKARLEAESMVAAIVQEAELRAAIAQYGEDSIQVEELRAEAQRAALATKLDELGVTEEVKEELLASAQAAWDVAAGAEGAAGAIAGAANQAARMSAEIQNAVNGLISMQAQGITSLRESEIRLANRGDAVGTAGALARERIMAEQAPLREGAGVGEIAYLNQQAEAYVRNAEATAANRDELAAFNREQARVNRASGGGSGGRGGLSDAARELKRQNDELDRIAASIFNSTRTKEQEFTSDLDDIRRAFETGRIDADTYEIAVDNLMGQFADERGPQYGELLDALTLKYEKGEISQAAFTNGVTELNEAFAETNDTALQMEGALEDMFVSILDGSKSASDAVADLAREFGNMALKAAFSGIFGGVFDGIAGIFSSGQGNVFEGGNRVAFGNGGVVNKRTRFPMGNGQIGEAGEMGAEAIIPLRRGSDGKLGVRAEMPQAVHAPQIQQGDVIAPVFSPQIDASGADTAAVRRLETAMGRMQGEFEGRVIEAVVKGKKRRLLK